jgi:hypothetical protein
MSPIIPNGEEAFVPRESRLSDDLVSYIAALAARAPGSVTFRTGAGRIFRDLLLHWPTLEDWEIEAQALCNKIAEAVYPLTGALYAQAVEISVTISPQRVEPPAHIDTLSSFVVFDAENRVERLFFLSPHHDLPSVDLMRVSKGVEVLCRPLNYLYHTIKDDLPLFEHVRTGIFEWPKRLLDAIYEEPPFTPEETGIIDGVKAKLYELPQLMQRYRASRDTALSLQSPNAPPRSTPEISTVTALSALPPPVRAFERQLMLYVTNPTLSPRLRLRFRQIAQALRAHYPQATIEEAARAELAPPVVAPAVSGARPSFEAAPQEEPVRRRTTGRPVPRQEISFASPLMNVSRPIVSASAPRTQPSRTPASPLRTASRIETPVSPPVNIPQPVIPASTLRTEATTTRSTPRRETQQPPKASPRTVFRQRERPEDGLRDTYSMLRLFPSGSFPRTVLVGGSGKLHKTTRVPPVQAAASPKISAQRQKSRTWAFPTPMPEPFPRIPRSGAKK